MPAKKKSATKKTAAKKAPAKKAPAKKTPAKKAAAKKSAVKKAAAKKSTKKAATKKSSAPNGSAKPKASELLKRTKHHTPTIFKVGRRKAAPVIFTLEDVREILKKRAKEESKQPAPEPKKAAKKAVKKPKPLPDTLEPEAGKREAASLADILGFGGGALGGTTPATKTVPKKWKRFHELLCELRDHVHESLGMHAEDTLKRSQKEDTGDLSTSADAGTDTFDRDFALSVVSSEQEALKEIEAAIDRIHKGSYGVCEITGEKISDERLEAVPFTRFSLEGQRQYELTARRRVSRSGSFLSEGADGVSFGNDDDDN